MADSFSADWYQVGRPEWDDQQQILTYLQQVRRPTFFTRDLGFFRRRYSHSNYCLVVVTGLVLETAVMIRRFLRHPQFKRDYCVAAKS